MRYSLCTLIILLVMSAAIAAVCCAAEKKKSSGSQNTDNRNSAVDYFDQYIPEEFYTRIKKGDFNRNIYPRFSDRQAWKKASKSKYADIIISSADAILGKDIPRLEFSEFRRFAVDGNRSEYEKKYYERRRNLGFTALAMCLTGNKEKYMATVLDYTFAILEEFSWTFPAHSYWKGKRLLDVANTDLFCAETGAMMALLYHILGEELDKEVENLSEKIRQETLKRTLYNIFYTPHVKVHRRYWWFDFVNRKNNWTPWCSSNCILTAILLEKDNEKLAYFIHRLLQANALFVARYSEDGFCDEGCDYYYAGSLRLFWVFYLLNKIQPNSMTKVLAVPKIRAIFEFIAHCNITDKYRINFADSHAKSGDKTAAALVICGNLIDSDILQDFTSGKSFGIGGLGAELKSCMCILFDTPDQTELKKKTVNSFTCFKDRIAILRSGTFSATLKAGNNAESHNHNDLGHFTLFYKGKPVIVDAGTEYYSQINFSDKRYTLWYTRGSGHNAPVFGNTEQLYGGEYKAGFISAGKDRVVCDLSNAYPAAAGVKKFVRTLDFSADHVTISDNFKLEKSEAANIRLLTLCDVAQLANGEIKIGGVIMKLDGIEFVKTEKLPKMNGGWNCVLTEIWLKSSNDHYSISFAVEKNGGGAHN